MRRVFLDGHRICSIADFHSAIAAAVPLPDYYGHNLDALDECLCDLEEPVHLVWMHSEFAREALGDAVFESILCVFNFAARTDDPAVKEGAGRFSFQLA